MTSGKGERPTLLSKVALFVRNPTKDWAELDRGEAEQEASYDKQALKAVIERKRQNDFIRKREFDQLRKLRNRNLEGLAAREALRPSAFRSSLPSDLEERSVTLKKIDEIEAQMSKQWWKGRAQTTAAALVTPAADAAPTGSADTAGPEFAPTLQAETRAEDLSEEFAPTVMAAELATRPPAEPAPPSPLDCVSASTQVPLSAETLPNDPELEEAAILFANGDDAGAEAGLLEVLRARTGTAESRRAWAAALLDLYRATGNEAGFWAARAEFAAAFAERHPTWRRISTAAAPLLAQPQGGAETGPPALWRSPALLSVQAMEELRSALSGQAPPWLLDWTALADIAPEAMPLLGGFLGSLCREEVGVQFIGGQHLAQSLRHQCAAGDRSTPQGWWQVRLDALRVMRLRDEFELTALDYCVTYGGTPPAWEDARCDFASADPTNASPAESIWQTSPAPLDGPTVPTPASRIFEMELSGQVLGDATAVLAALDAIGQSFTQVDVHCASLVRVDFSAAGSLLNWVAERQARGVTVRFVQLHRLVATFFNVIGINEHAQVLTHDL